MRDFRELAVWQKAHRFVVEVYRHSADFPRDERFGLTAQLRRAALSVPSNTAEGCGRGGDRELSRFLTIAGGSASEVEYQLLLARDLGFLPGRLHDQLDGQVNELKKMLTGFIRRLGESR